MQNQNEKDRLKKINKNMQKLICILCPIGCEISVTLDNDTIQKIEGNACKLGVNYVKTEIENPKRIVTSTVRVKGGRRPQVSVWTPVAIPKDRIFDLMDELRKVEINAPVRIDDIVIENLFGLGVDVTASGNVKKI